MFECAYFNFNAISTKKQKRFQSFTYFKALFKYSYDVCYDTLYQAITSKSAELCTLLSSCNYRSCLNLSNICLSYIIYTEEMFVSSCQSTRRREQKISLVHWRDFANFSSFTSKMLCRREKFLFFDSYVDYAYNTIFTWCWMKFVISFDIFDRLLALPPFLHILVTSTSYEIRHRGNE